MSETKTQDTPAAVAEELRPGAVPAAAAPDPKTPATFDLGDLDLESSAAQGAELQLRHPVTGQPMGIYLHLVGADSQTYRDAYRKVIDDASQDSRRNLDSSVFELRAAQAAAGACLGWRTGDDRGYVMYNGQRLAFSRENAVTLFVSRRWIREQAELFMSNRANFFGG